MPQVQIKGDKHHARTNLEFARSNQVLLEKVENDRREFVHTRVGRGARRANVD